MALKRQILKRLIKDSNPDLSRVYAVSKCFNLLKSITPLLNEEEVKEILAQIESLMVIHNIAMQEITEPEEKNFETWKEILKTRYGHWDYRALNICTQYYLVEGCYGNYHINFFGLPPNLFIAKEVYRSLLFSFDFFWKEHRKLYRYYGKIESKRRAFVDGMADRICQRLDKELSKKIKIPLIQTSAKGMITTKNRSLRTLVAPNQKLITAIFHDVFNLKSGKSFSFDDDESEALDYNEGFRKGNEIKLPLLRAGD